MEERVIVSCPYCAKAYKIRQELLGRNAKCCNCKQTFPLIVPHVLNEDEILNLVQGPAHRDDDDDAEPQNATVAGLKVVADEPMAPAAAFGAKMKTTEDLGPPIRLQAIDSKGVHFRFAAAHLGSEKFRAFIPKLCAGCLDKRGLQVFLLRWRIKNVPLAGYGDVGALRPVALMSELPVVDNRELLKYLPVDHSLPEPFGLPFPFYVCGRCKPEGLVYPVGEVDPDERVCMLVMANLKLALEFYTDNCGNETSDYHKLITQKTLCKRSRWEALAELEQKRIAAWVKPRERESFVCYVADLDTPAARKGETGIVVTDQRIVCGKEPLYRHYPFSESITVSCHSVTDGMKVDISSSQQGRITFRLTDSAWVDLKHALRDLKTNVRLVEI